MTKKLQKQLDDLVGNWVSVNNSNTRHYVFIMSGILQKNKDGSYFIREPRSYVNFRRCLFITEGDAVEIPKIYV